jgi:hypothetical protein
MYNIYIYNVYTHAYSLHNVGVIRLVDEALKEDIPIAVCSTSNEKAVTQIVKMMGPERAGKIRIFAGTLFLMHV